MRVLRRILVALTIGVALTVLVAWGLAPSWGDLYGRREFHPRSARADFWKKDGGWVAAPSLEEETQAELIQKDHVFFDGMLAY